MIDLLDHDIWVPCLKTKVTFIECIRMCTACPECIVESCVGMNFCVAGGGVACCFVIHVSMPLNALSCNVGQRHL